MNAGAKGALANSFKMSRRNKSMQASQVEVASFGIAKFSNS